MKKFYVIALTFCCATSRAQTVTVKPTSEKVKGDKLDGFSTELEGKNSDINSQWNKFLKEVGRVKMFSSDPQVITEPNFNGTVYPKGILYAYIFDNGNLTRHGRRKMLSSLISNWRSWFTNSVFSFTDRKCRRKSMRPRKQRMPLKNKSSGWSIKTKT